MQEQILLDLVDILYEAAVEPDKYETFLKWLSKAVHGQCAALLAHDTVSWRSSVAVSVGLDEAALERDRRYADLNPFIARGKPYMLAGTVVTGNMIIPDEELVRTEYYNDHFRPCDLHHVIGGTITCNSNSAALISAIRSKRRGPFDATEVQLFQALDPHLRRSIAIQKRLAEQEGHREALDKISKGCVLLGKGGKVLAVNAAAEKMIGCMDGLVCSNGWLDATVPESSSRLRELISSATSNLYHANPGGVAVVMRPSGALAYTVLVAPLSRKGPDWGEVLPLGVVFISDPNSSPINEELMMDLYHFTPAEARLARALTRGEGLGQAAEKLKIGINTAKTHLQRVFSKTQTCRQAELVLLLASVANMSSIQGSVEASHGPQTGSSHTSA